MSAVAAAVDTTSSVGRLAAAQAANTCKILYKFGNLPDGLE
ncbi:MAG TPA: hypothetical protein VKR57_11175 [Terriglobales bacterium]|nr:hypothetical protein [Terriglobales bacterium]